MTREEGRIRKIVRHWLSLHWEFRVEDGESFFRRIHVEPTGRGSGGHGGYERFEFRGYIQEEVPSACVGCGFERLAEEELFICRKARLSDGASIESVVWCIDRKGKPLDDGIASLSLAQVIIAQSLAQDQRRSLPVRTRPKSSPAVVQ